MRRRAPRPARQAISRFGASSLDRTHTFTIAGVLKMPGGFRFSANASFITSAPLSIWVPNTLSTLGFFSGDLSSDGGTGPTPRVDVFPETVLGGSGRGVKGFEALDRVSRRSARTTRGA
jgi:hypothetical protein